MATYFKLIALIKSILRRRSLEISKITDYLYIGTQPKNFDYDILRDLRIALIINMVGERPPFPDAGTSKIETLHLKTYDSIFQPIPVEILMKGVNAALEVIDSGGRVFAHCAAGVHRSIAQGACILIAKGLSAEEAALIIKTRRPEADPYAWYIWRKIKKFEKMWSNHQN